MSVFDNKISNGDTIVLPLRENIFLDGSNSGDFDSEAIQYLWRNIPDSNQKFQTFKKLTLTKNTRDQNIYIENDGPFKIGFRVFDGVSYSDEIVVIIQTIEKPDKLIVLDSTALSVHYKNLNNLYPNVKQKAQIFFEDEGFSKNEFDNIIISEERIEDKFLKSSQRKLLDSFDIKKYNENNVSYIDFSSSFPAPEITNEKNLYLYNIGNDSVLSDVVKIKHRLIVRSPFIIQLIAGPIELGSSGIKLSTEDGIEYESGLGQSFLGIDLGVGLLITESVEFGVSIGLVNTQKAYFSNFEVNMSSRFSTWLSYTFYTEGRFNPYIGGELKSYSFSDRNIEDDFQIAYTLGGKLGVLYPLDRGNNFDVDLKLDLSYGTFTKTELTDLYVIRMGMSVAFRF